MIPGWVSRPRSIFANTLIIVAGVMIALAAINMALILLRPPPQDAFISAYEVARMLRGDPIAKDTRTIGTRDGPLPSYPPENPVERMMRMAIADHLGRPPTEIRVFHDVPFRATEGVGGSSPVLAAMRREWALYRHEGEFNPSMMGSFEAAVRLDGDQWRVVRHTGSQSLQRWLDTTLVLFAVVLAAMLLLAWLFSKWIAKPIRELADAADRLGRDTRVEPVAVRGPLEVRMAAAAINDMQARLQHYMAERTRVMAAIAHDLRTPLARLEFLLASAPEALRQRVESEIAAMEEMISTTMDFVQGVAQDRPHELLDIALLVEGIVDDFADTGADVRIGRTEPVTVMGDPLRLKRLFSNLISNAVTYGQRAEVEVRVEGNRVIVEICDEGPGLGEQDIARAFEPFFRAESSRSRSTGGMGLGLAIVEAAAQAHGGSVELSNRPQGGLCARVTLPIEQAPAVEKATPAR